MGLISNGTTIFDNGSMASGIGADLKFISKATASSSASIEFSLGDYKEYQFYFVNIHGSVDGQALTFQVSTDNGSSYGVNITSTFFQAKHKENDTEASLGYNAGKDLAQSTSFQQIMDLGNQADECGSGYMSIFNPSSNIYVKHFISTSSCYGDDDAEFNAYASGYINDINDLTNIKFQMSSGNIDAGEILLFGVN